MMRPPRDRSDPKAIDESTDTYDTIEYLLKHVPNNNGRAGVFGHLLSGLAHRDGVPSTRIRRCGRFPSRPRPPTCSWATTSITTARFASATASNTRPRWRPDAPTTRFPSTATTPSNGICGLTPLSAANERWFRRRSCPPGTPSSSTPTTTRSGRSIAVPRYLGSPTVPNLNVAGWWDQEDFYGPVKIYETLEAGRSRRTAITWWPGRGTTAAGRAARAGRWARSISRATRRGTTARRSRRPGSPTG